MSAQRWGLRGLALAAALATCGMMFGQDRLPLQPKQDSGASVTGAYEGWFQNPDGSYSLLLGYYNRNLDQAVDVPIGPDNSIEPGGPDQGQPTHFLPGRTWGIFAVKVPKDFGNKTLTWTITANGVKTQIPMSLAPLWVLEPFKDATGNTPAYVGFSADGPFVNGPIGQTETISGTVGTPLPIKIWVADDDYAPLVSSRIFPRRAPVTVDWSEYRGPAPVKFDNAKPAVEKIDLNSPPAGTKYDGTTATTVTFDQPGEYELNVQAYDSSGVGGNGFQCCWSNTKVKVSVK
jgi:hypothetical protein